MSLFNIPGFGHEAAHDQSGYVEASPSLLHEVEGVFRPVLMRRSETLNTAVDGNILPQAYNRLGGDAISAIMRAIEDTPAMPPQADAAVYGQPAAETVPSAAIQERQSSFWGDDPEEKELIKRAGWAGDVAPEPEDPSRLQTSVQNAEQFFAQDFQMIPQSVADQPMPQASAYPMTEQDVKADAGIANPYVDETRQMWDAVDAMPEINVNAPVQGAAEITARIEAARQQVSEAQS